MSNIIITSQECITNSLEELREIIFSLPDNLDEIIKINGKYVPCKIYIPIKYTGKKWQNINNSFRYLFFSKKRMTFLDFSRYLQRKIQNRINKIYNNSEIQISAKVTVQEGCIEAIVTLIVEIVKELPPMKAYVFIAGLVLSVGLYSGSNMYVAHEQYNAEVQKYNTEVQKGKNLHSLLNFKDIFSEREDFLEFSKAYFSQSAVNYIHNIYAQNPVMEEAKKLLTKEDDKITINDIKIVKPIEKKQETEQNFSNSPFSFGTI